MLRHEVIQIGPPSWIDASWWEVYGAELRAHELSQREWVNRLAKALCIVRRADSLSADELEAQQDWVDRLLGRKYFHTYPLPAWDPRDHVTGEVPDAEA